MKFFKYFLSTAAIIAVLAYGYFRFHAPQKHTQIRPLMGTTVRLDVCLKGVPSETLERAYSTVWKRMEEISWRMNVYDRNSDVSRVNRSLNEPVTVEEDTFHVFESAKKFHRFTGGAFDITVWPLIELWRAKEKQGSLPTGDEIRETLSAVGMDQIELLPDREVRRLNTATKIDLGGIAKGYAIDEAARIFKGFGIDDFFIDAGGDVYAAGLNCRQELWRVGIRDPRDPTKIMEVVSVSDAAVTTSGNYAQYFQFDGKKFSHIINPVSGYPQEGTISATVIAPSAEAADALSTALTVLDPQQATELLSRLGNAYASLIVTGNQDTDHRVWRSRTYKHYVPARL